jgi:hypothetical protein
MTRKEQLASIPYPTELGESPDDKRDYTLAMAVTEYLHAVPQTKSEGELMFADLPKHLKGAHDRGEIRWSMVKYLLGRLKEMEASEG